MSGNDSTPEADGPGPAGPSTDRLIREQREYYRARVPEYDEWFLRLGRYDRGPEHRAQWFAELAVAEAALRETVTGACVLEVACGTGLWTRHLVAGNTRIVAVDASPEAIALNRQRVASDRVRYLVADLFAWQPPARAFDAVVCAFWLSHVPDDRFEPFWEGLRAALRPGGVVFFVDSRPEQYSTAVDHPPLGLSGTVTRRLNDGREFEIVKVFYEPRALEQRLAALGWKGWVRSTKTFFIYGAVRRGTADA